MIIINKRHFYTEMDGGYGVYWQCKKESDCAMLGLNVMTMSPAKKDYGHHNYPLERIEKAIRWLKTSGNQKIGIVGASTTGTLALTAASYFEDITLTNCNVQ